MINLYLLIAKFHIVLSSINIEVEFHLFFKLTFSEIPEQKKVVPRGRVLARILRMPVQSR